MTSMYASFVLRERIWNATRRCNDRERREGSEMHRLSIYVQKYGNLNRGKRKDSPIRNLEKRGRVSNKQNDNY